jgi:hypothetical protein
VAALIDTFCPPHPAHVLSCGRGAEALLLAILDGHQALYKVRARLEERGMLPLLQPHLTSTALHDYRLGQILDTLFAANLNRVFGAVARMPRCSRYTRNSISRWKPGFRWINNPAAISPVWLEKTEQIAALAMLTGVGLLVYAVIQRQVRLYLRDHGRHISGNKGSTATPTTAVVFALFTPVTLVRFTVDNAPVLQVHGIQDDHLIVCKAVGIDHAWYQGVAVGQNALLSATPP